MVQKYGAINHENFQFKGYTIEELLELIEGWEMDAEAIGSDLYDMTGDLAIGPKIMRDLIAKIKELQNDSQAFC